MSFNQNKSHNNQSQHSYLPVSTRDTSSTIVDGIDVQEDHTSPSTYRFLYLVGGVFLFYLLYGIFQERIFRDPILKQYGWYITFVQFVYYTVFSLLVERSIRRRMPMRLYAVIALLTVTTMACSNSSLQYLSYPTQVIFKSSKLIPVMIGGVLIQNKKYQISDYVASALMSVGLVLFTLADAAGKKGNETQTQGLVLICLALCADAVIGNVQEKWIKQHKSSNGEVIMYSYGIGCLYVLAKITLEGTLLEASTYCNEHPYDSYVMTFGFSLCGYLGVKFVLDLVREYGALLAVTVTTCRKAVTMVLSFVIFPKPFTFQHLFSGSLVIGGICLRIYKKNKESIDKIIFDAIGKVGGQRREMYQTGMFKMQNV